ncbi:hypothetical protein LOD99_13975 [Oopsacas minuta]|uniref:peptide-O-fucosyltransferase n=1 Tax=Oopsacas minuta TaxID=111878 RepID=A0AAV7KH09_9METZ|nr:hypothetical protein LOD99_13975 [Oopsacas minuta]
MTSNFKHIPQIKSSLLILLLLFSTVFLIYIFTSTADIVSTPLNSYTITYYNISQTRTEPPSVKTRPPSIVTHSKPLYLSYQPPGNGWNNQRMAFEHAVVFSRLLNRTLLAPPMAPHLPFMRYKGQGLNDTYTGYKVYNDLTADQLIPMDSIIDFKLLSELIQVRASSGSHIDFLKRNSALSWRRVCHSPGYGFWMDRRPKNERENETLQFQSYIIMADWLNKCSEEKKLLENGQKRPFIRFLLDELSNINDDIIYFEEGTLFGIDFRFQELQDVVKAQTWISKFIIYHPQIVKVANSVEKYLIDKSSHGYNAMHVRRNDRNSKYSAKFWLKRVKKEFKLPPLLPLYVSTDESNLMFFETFREAGYTLVFRQNIQDLFVLGNTGPSKRDVDGMSEQIVCARAKSFVPSMRSTFTTLILRMRDELPRRDGVFLKGYYFIWAEHFIDEKAMKKYKFGKI